VTSRRVVLIAITHILAIILGFLLGWYRHG
jgi:hypothetical protein